MFKISLSAGHSLVTPGKQTPDGMHEWEFNAAVVSKMVELFSHYKDVAVLRLDDPTGKTDIPLKTRASRSNDWGANFHLDVHANAAGSTWSDAHGIETFSYKLSGKSFDVAKCLQHALIQATGLSDRGVKDGSDLYMVNSTKATACLVECGFMSNKNEAAFLKSDDYRTKVAIALVNAIASYFNLVKNPVVVAAAVSPKKYGLDPLPPKRADLYRMALLRDCVESDIPELQKAGYRIIELPH
jgi:N-acetylmuramoyl-L-alanine amidase